MINDFVNDLLYRALEIIQDEEYLDVTDFDEIRRQKIKREFKTMPDNYLGDLVGHRNKRQTGRSL